MRDEAVSAVIGIILMVGITASLGLGVVYIADDVKDEVGDANYMGMDRTSDGYVIVTTPADDVQWADVTVNGCTKPVSGVMAAGDQLTACSGTVTVAWDGELLFKDTF